MLCEDFRQRMNQCLDNRLALESDSELMQHVDCCESCRAHVAAWDRIASVMSHRDQTSDELAGAGGIERVGLRRRRGIVSSAGLAAAVLLAIVSMWDRSPSNSEPSDTLPAAEAARSDFLLAQAGGDDVDPSLWWRSVQDRDWVGQTMPAVRSVQQGVAPLGRSLRQALTILTIGGRDQTS